MRKFQNCLAFGSCLLLLITGGCAEMQGSGGELAGTLLRSLPTGGSQGGALDESTVASGLKEALRVGSERTVASTALRRLRPLA